MNKVSTLKSGFFNEVGLTKTAWDPGYDSNSPSESVLKFGFNFEFPVFFAEKLSCLYCT